MIRALSVECLRKTAVVIWTVMVDRIESEPNDEHKGKDAYWSLTMSIDRLIGSTRRKSLPSRTTQCFDCLS